MTKDKSKTKPPYPNNLRNLIKVAGLNQAQFARKMGWNEADVSRRSNGLNSITPPQLDELYEKLRWTPSQIYGKEAIVEMKDVTVINSGELEGARDQLDSAIEMWFTKDKSTAAIHTLAIAAYKGIFSEIITEDIETEASEMIILACVMRLQFKEIPLTKIEVAFNLWFSTKNTELFEVEFRRFSSEYIEMSNKGKPGKLKKDEFFRVFTSRNNSIIG